MSQYKFKEAIVFPLSDNSELALVVYEFKGRSVLVPAFADPSQIPVFEQLLKEYGNRSEHGEILASNIEFVLDLVRNKQIN